MSQNLSNILVSGGADKQLRLWDARSGICFNTLSHHQNVINDAKFNFIVCVLSVLTFLA